jgi:hypothetical protein
MFQILRWNKPARPFERAILRRHNAFSGARRNPEIRRQFP